MAAETAKEAARSAALPKYLGQPIKRREDPRLITGQGTYVDDVNLPGMVYLAVLRSPHAHARITSINLDPAREARLAWSRWRRRHQARAKRCHYQRRASRLLPELRL